MERRSTIVDHVGWLPLVPDNELYRVSRVESPLVLALTAKVVAGGPHAERANAKEGRADQVLGRLDCIQCVVEFFYSGIKYLLSFIPNHFLLATAGTRLSSVQKVLLQ